MKRKILIIGIVLMIASALAFSQEGRFQLYGCVITEETDKGQMIEVKHLFKIDTQTGKTWKYAQRVKTHMEALQKKDKQDETIRIWLPVEDQ